MSSEASATRPPRVLLIDDERSILSAYARLLRGEVDLVTARGGDEAFQAVQASEAPFAVVLCDLKMPGPDGIEVLSRIRSISPDTVRVLFTGQADLAAAVEAVNTGEIFRFLRKPCLPDVMRACIGACVRQHRLLTAERELFERTVAGTVRLLSELMALVSPSGSARAGRLRRYVRHMADAMGLKEVWQFELAAVLSSLPTLSLEHQAFNRYASSQPRTPEERRAFEAQADIAASLVAHVPRLESIAAMINAGAGDAAAPTAREAAAIATGAALLRVASAYDVEMVRGAQPAAALAALHANRDIFPPRMVSALATLPTPAPLTHAAEVTVGQLSTRMVLDCDVRSTSGLLLAPQGQQVTPTLLDLLQGYHRLVGVVEPIRVRTEAGPPLSIVR